MSPLKNTDAPEIPACFVEMGTWWLEYEDRTVPTLVAYDENGTFAASATMYPMSDDGFIWRVQTTQGRKTHKRSMNIRALMFAFKALRPHEVRDQLSPTLAQEVGVEYAIERVCLRTGNYLILPAPAHAQEPGWLNIVVCIHLDAGTVRELKDYFMRVYKMIK